MYVVDNEIEIIEIRFIVFVLGGFFFEIFFGDVLVVLLFVKIL